MNDLTTWFCTRQLVDAWVLEGIGVLVAHVLLGLL
jgi:hypothetical protein